MGFSSIFIRRPIATSLLMAAVLLLGILGYRALPVSALPQIDAPTLVVTTQYPGASAQTVATLVTTPLERQLGQISGIHDDEFGQLRRAVHHRPAVHHEARHRRRRAGRAVGAARGAAAGRTALPAGLQPGQSGRRADHDPGDDLGQPAAARGQQLRRLDHRAEALAGVRRGPGVDRRQRQAGRARAGQPGAAGQPRPDHGGRAQRADPRQRQCRQGHPERRHPDLLHRHQRPAVHAPSSTATSSSATRTARRCTCATWPRWSTAWRTTSWRPGPTASPRCCWTSAASPAPTSSTRCEHIRAMLPQLRERAAGRRAPGRVRRPHRDHPRLGARRAVHPDADRAAGGGGDLRVPAAAVGDGDPLGGGAAVAAGHLRGDGLRPACRWTTCR